MRGVNDGEGLARRYNERRASVSSQVSGTLITLKSSLPTFMVCIEHILVRIPQGKLIRNGRLLPAVLLPPPTGAVCRHGFEEVALCLWRSTWAPLLAFTAASRSGQRSAPRTSRLFSGSRFPLEMLSNKGFQISSLFSSRLPGRSWLPGVRVEAVAGEPRGSTRAGHCGGRRRRGGCVCARAAWRSMQVLGGRLYVG